MFNLPTYSEKQEYYTRKTLLKQSTLYIKKWVFKVGNILFPVVLICFDSRFTSLVSAREIHLLYNTMAPIVIVVICWIF